jgi:heparan-alpha-glucosaminide N-acetyltransferase
MATLITDHPAAETVLPPSAVPAASPAAPASKPARLLSLDAYRGLIMVVLASGGLGFTAVYKSFPDSPEWRFLAWHTDHVAWIGCSFWDLIQPSFMFMVGVAVPYSLASRRVRGDSETKIRAHVLWRALVLVALGVFLSSSPWPTPANPHPRTNFTFVNVLTQIGLGYVFLCLLAGRCVKVQAVWLGIILVGYWLLFFLWPLPAEGYDYANLAGWKPEWRGLEGWWAHWDKNTNAAAAFDSWFLPLFPPKDGVHPFVFNDGGYQTLNFVPSLATMLMGLMAGEMLRGRRRPQAKLLVLVVAAVACLGIGWAAGQTVCPLVKRIWTPSWAIFSTGWCFAILAALFAVIDVAGWRRWAFPLVVVGMNSIAMYVMIQLLSGWIRASWRTHLPLSWFAGPYAPIVQASLGLATLWLVCAWLYRRGIFLRI